MSKSSFFSLCAGSFVALTLAAGCSNNAKKSNPTRTAQKPVNHASTPTEAKPAPAPTPTPVAVQPAPVPAPAPSNAMAAQPKNEPVAVSPAPSQEPQFQQASSSDDERREQAANLIYAQIRVKMEEAIDERAKLLKSGTDPADTKVRELEGRIMRARELLTGNGELVEEVEPPIVQKNP
jgi:hypothetical protein